MKQFKKSPRQQLEKFSTIFMQLGLVLVLFIVFVSLEHETEQTAILIEKPTKEVEYVYSLDKPVVYVKEVIKKPEIKRQKPVTTIIEKPEVVDNNTPDETIFKTIIEEPKVVEEGTIIEEDVPEEDIIVEDVPFSIIEEVPVYPGCKGSKEEKKACFSKKLTKLIQKKFDTDLVNELGYESGKKVRIYVQFKIDKTGEIVNINVKAPHPRLKKEAIRMANQIPTMKPGRQRDIAVSVNYTLPIVLKSE